MTVAEAIEILKTMPYGAVINGGDNGALLKYIRQHHEDKMTINLIFTDYKYIDHIDRLVEKENDG